MPDVVGHVQPEETVVLALHALLHPLRHRLRLSPALGRPLVPLGGEKALLGLAELQRATPAPRGQVHRQMGLRMHALEGAPVGLPLLQELEQVRPLVGEGAPGARGPAVGRRAHELRVEVCGEVLQHSVPLPVPAVEETRAGRIELAISDSPELGLVHKDYAECATRVSGHVREGDGIIGPAHGTFPGNLGYGVGALSICRQTIGVSGRRHHCDAVPRGLEEAAALAVQRVEVHKIRPEQSTDLVQRSLQRVVPLVGLQPARHQAVGAARAAPLGGLQQLPPQERVAAQHLHQRSHEEGAFLNSPHGQQVVSGEQAPLHHLPVDLVRPGLQLQPPQAQAQARRAAPEELLYDSPHQEQDQRVPQCQLDGLPEDPRCQPSQASGQRSLGAAAAGRHLPPDLGPRLPRGAAVGET
mmetsp:Transcript_101557/g.296026  ORF Transcript_101557/g.296026 Transcript_101557/m.296026 type:complete len:413 (+) Transcript_101557:287-1525(+)